MPQQRYMLDTNTVSYIIKGGPPAVKERLRAVPMASVCISAITEAELGYGVMRSPKGSKIGLAAREFLARVEIPAWDSDAAIKYAWLRTICADEGKSLGNMDMLIAAHSLAVEATLVTSDKAFYNVDHLILEDWTIAPQHG